MLLSTYSRPLLVFLCSTQQHHLSISDLCLNKPCSLLPLHSTHLYRLSLPNPTALSLSLSLRFLTAPLALFCGLSFSVERPFRVRMQYLGSALMLLLHLRLRLRACVCVRVRAGEATNQRWVLAIMVPSVAMQRYTRLHTYTRTLSSVSYIIHTLTIAFFLRPFSNEDGCALTLLLHPRLRCMRPCGGSRAESSTR